MAATEVWRPIARHEGYEVSDRGRVRSVDRVVTRMHRGRAVPARYKGRVLKLSTASGYPHVRLGGRGRAYVHHLVLEAFVGPRPAGDQAAHGDGDRLNNVLGNLRWATPKENNGDKRSHGTAMLGTRNPMGAKTHCKRGHRFDDENTRRANGRRVCRACARDSERRRRAAAVITTEAAPSY
jgi:hypothetical protein